MKEKLEKIRDMLQELINSLEPVMNQNTQPESPKDTSEFKLLSDLLKSDEWPEAVFQIQIADENSEKDKEERAEGIADMLLPPLGGKKFLDFGCGEGHVAKYVSKDASTAVGYDIVKSGSQVWEENTEGFILTQNFDTVRANGPYDVILIYDVLDHVQSTIESVLEQAKSVLAQEGRIYIRCHPWVSRHGGHAYRKINKAFIHLVFNDQELKDLGIDLEFNNRVFMPLITYGTAIKNVNLKLESEPELDTQEVEEFFSLNPLIRSRILKSFGITEWKAEKPGFQLSQCFVDYILKS